MAFVIKIIFAFLLIEFSLQNINAENDTKLKTCYTCKGISCLRSTLMDKTQQCLDALDYCVTIFEKFQVVHKGCYLQVPERLRKRCDQNTAECHKCNSSKCNNLGQKGFACLQCDSSKDKNCATSPSSLSASQCMIPTTTNSYCYIKTENNVTKRGCATTLEDQRACYDNKNCMLCLAEDMAHCNSVNFTPTMREILMGKIIL